MMAGFCKRLVRGRRTNSDCCLEGERCLLFLLVVRATGKRPQKRSARNDSISASSGWASITRIRANRPALTCLRLPGAVRSFCATIVTLGDAAHSTTVVACLSHAQPVDSSRWDLPSTAQRRRSGPEFVQHSIRIVLHYNEKGPTNSGTSGLVSQHREPLPSR